MMMLTHGGFGRQQKGIAVLTTSAIDDVRIARYLDSLAGLVREARVTRNPLVLQVALGVLELQSKTVRQLLAQF